MGIIGKKTWLLRGGAVAVIAALVGAWAVGLAGAGDSGPPGGRHATAATSDDPPRPVIHRAIVVKRAEPRRTSGTDPSPAAFTEAGPDAAEEPATELPSAPGPTSDATTPDPSDPSLSPDPSPTPDPPSSPPSRPGEECTDLVSVVDCALDPITGRP
jgi:hypothetical protein